MSNDRFLSNSVHTILVYELSGLEFGAKLDLPSSDPKMDDGRASSARAASGAKFSKNAPGKTLLAKWVCAS